MVHLANMLTFSPAYAAYFDHKRQTDPNFRKALKRESRRVARAAKEEEEAQGAQQKEAIKAAVNEAKEEGFPTNVEDKEAYFMNEVGKGESLCQDGMNRLVRDTMVNTGADLLSESSRMDAALCFYKALKVYPQPKDLISIYDKTVPKPVIDILAEMIALDPSISVPSFGEGSGPGSSTGIDD